MSVLDQFNLSDQRALLTGGARGLGYAFATAVAETGADAVIVDIDEEADDEAAVVLADETGQQAIPVIADVIDEDGNRSDVRGG